MEGSRNIIGKETLGKFFYDLAKIAFTALVAGGIIQALSESGNHAYWALAIFGIVATYVLALIFNIKKDIIMEALIVIFIFIIAFGIGFIIWMNSKPGKDWLKNL